MVGSVPILVARGRRTRIRRQPRMRRPRPTVASLDKRIKKLNSNIETKFKDENINVSITPAGTLLNAFCLVDSDNSASGREGNWITPTSLVYRLKMEPGVRTLAATDLTELVRIIVFWDGQPNGAVPTAAGLDGLLDNSVINTPAFMPRNTNTRKRFKILHDKTYNMVLSGGDTSGAFMIAPFAINKIKLARKIGFDAEDATTDITNVTSNSLNIFFFSLNNATSVALDGGVRMYFRDV